MLTQRSAALAQPGPRAETWVVVLASTGVFLVALELTVVSVALPDIIRSLGERGNPAVAWIFSVYNIVVACLLLVFGWLADRIGHRRVFIAGLLVFAVGSAASGCASDLNTLIGGRAVQGLGGSMMMPASLALILAAVAGPERDRAIATWGAMAGLAAALGPVAGGALVAAAGWRAVFLLNVPIALAAVWLTRLNVMESPVVAGVVRTKLGAGVGFGSAVLEILQAPIALVRLPGFCWAGLATLPFVAGFTAWVVMVPSFLHELWGYSTAQVGVAMMPAPLMMVVVSRPATRLLTLFGYRGVIAAGAMLAAAGALWWWLLIQQTPDYLFSFLPGAMLFGAGIGMGFPMLAAAAVRDVPAARYAAGTAGVITIRQAAMAVGAAVALLTVGEQQATSKQNLFGNHAELWLLCAGLLVLAALLISGLPAAQENSDDSI